MRLADWWHGRGQHRAADRIPVLTHERNLWLLVALRQAADNVKVGRERDTVTAVANHLAADLHELQGQHENLLGEHAELVARHAEATAVSVPAPADGQPAIREPDNETTREMTISAIWGMDGSRTWIPTKAA
ncbi:hypothetical protein OG455_41845 [Kitasatospora sp. NBC_01287]|uniref:hypothetical protein n=1 Tax=Kitasatospora sp. NBC_01287 TaxID=2903573 RepID=UPI0022584482|nr:hypothetical protein [Kitasatospora sp. NBC_01287]MCX4751720.1 hypothetical protein [Kitasatospora sp. NBC_01287]MCX4751988.1 hypothetical protein [Kitasatospora sp. NBC_01287]